VRGGPSGRLCVMFLTNHTAQPVTVTLSWPAAAVTSVEVLPPTSPVRVITPMMLVSFIVGLLASSIANGDPTAAGKKSWKRRTPLSDCGQAFRLWAGHGPPSSAKCADCFARRGPRSGLTRKPFDHSNQGRAEQIEAVVGRREAVPLVQPDRGSEKRCR